MLPDPPPGYQRSLIEQDECLMIRSECVCCGRVLIGNAPDLMKWEVEHTRTCENSRVNTAIASKASAATAGKV